MAGSGVNKVILEGYLGADPELKETSGNPVCNVRLATSESWTDKSGTKQERTEWHSLVFWGDNAKRVADWYKKGEALYVEGKIQTRSWEDDGQKKYRTEVVCRMHRRPCGSKGGSSSSSSRNDDSGSSGPPPSEDDGIPF